eukprot:TRINITY_DN6875_c0_g1::TRINITY_DN6875_c0_g1_i1::g.17451::m.17451 TRINITY_DN6875_c0_g1::TRINITY_DN6875_c0_g1_i1::g.17451  ORF type:complete len:150 (+),score=7.67,sp/Q14562/DHX8_HUMAN/60.14/7e-51,AAA_22/PF13401.1/7.2e-08,DEAD/PF00270.24/0.0005,DUF2075/PF09848.4/0.00033,ABC_tran/PF00005.22/0.032,ABC_tran/PF00005.22/25,AAA_30/PF13604.1/0.003,T2SE/PF00437.15/0.0054,PhoH/PF02562.11/0.23,PhoH/PF02562.11/30,Miro/PF08477.8/0.0075,AAA_16/PF13191.1/0.023,AAA_16/PF13191.1/9.2e+02,ResIII/PF04851.10/4.1,ResII
MEDDTPEKLPIRLYKEEIVATVAANQFCVLVGETGSGKTTQLSQYLADDKERNYSSRGMIGVTQPRRVAAVGAASRVSSERGSKLGEEVGYSVRFDYCTSRKTVIKYMTDGWLLRECTADRTLSKYSVIILDEAHERSVATDILLGVVK